MREHASRMDVIELIESAFANVVLGEDIGIYQAEAIDNYASEKQVAKAREKDRESWEYWSEIPGEVLAKAYSTLCFVDAEGMRYLLPAYMLFSINNYVESASASIDSPIYALERGPDAFNGDVGILSMEQKRAIAAYLEFMVLTAGDYYVDASCASSAYESHWGQHVESA